MLHIKDLVTLDDDKTYVVSATAKFKDKIYYILIDKETKKDIKCVYEEGDELIEEEDQVFIKKILPLFIKSSITVLQKEQSD